MSQSSHDAAFVPQEVMVAINQSRPSCAYFKTKKGCKKGAKCPNLHSRTAENSHNLPHVSIYKVGDATVMSLRPPLQAALSIYFKKRGVDPQTIGPGKTIGQDGKYMLFQLVFMDEPDTRACQQARHTEVAKVYKRGGSSHRNPGKMTKVPFPHKLVHGPTIENCLSICCARQCRISQGVCGDGILN